MFVRFSLFAAVFASVIAVSIADARPPQRDLSYTNPNNRQTYGFVSCEWKRTPVVRERAAVGGMNYYIRNGIARCLPEGAGRPYVTDSDWTEITNVQCDGPKRADLTVVTCLRQHQGRLEARDGYFTFV
ncbi:MAG: hypothetical protein AAB250_17305, partial [Bdellovibrionota bacterium]